MCAPFPPLYESVCLYIFFTHRAPLLRLCAWCIYQRLLAIRYYAAKVVQKISIGNIAN